MKIICDTREQKNQHILKYFDDNEIQYIERKMNVADYQIEGIDNFVIDRKQNLDELATNLMNRNDKSRFWREVRRANQKGIKMIVLCEHGGQIRSLHDVSKWNSRFSNLSGRRLMDEIYRVSVSYGVEFVFCAKCDTGSEIIRLLTKGQKGALKCSETAM